MKKCGKGGREGGGRGWSNGRVVKGRGGGGGGGEGEEGGRWEGREVVKGEGLKEEEVVVKGIVKRFKRCNKNVRRGKKEWEG